MNGLGGPIRTPNGIPIGPVQPRRPAGRPAGRARSDPQDLSRNVTGTARGFRTPPRTFAPIKD